MLSAGPAVALTAALLLAVGTPAFAHETATVGPLEITVGWAAEPTYTGIENFVEVGVSEAGAGPVADVGTGLSVAVSFGPATTVLALGPGPRPGLARAALIPTQPGSYTFQVTGTVRGQSIDLTSTCSETSFDCVVDQSEIQFPAEGPTGGQLAERLNRELARGSRARADAVSARRLAIAGLAVGAAGLVTAIVALVRAGRTKRRLGPG